MNITLALDTPLLSIAEFAKRSGITIRSVQKQCETGQLPVIQRGVRGIRYINMVQLTQRCAESNSNEPWN